MLPGKLAGALIFLAGAVVTSVFFIDFCNLVYDCGCTHLWAGAAAHCNIHKAHPPHCPWCSIGMGGFASVYVAILAAQFVALRLTGAFSWPVRLLAVLAAFPAAAGVLAIVIGWQQGYWNQ
jgi:hypothetical protein